MTLQYKFIKLSIGKSYFFVIEGVKTSYYGGCCSCCMNHRKVYEWVELFKGGQTIVDDAGSRRPSTASCVTVKVQINQRIRYNRRSDIHEIKSEMSTTRGKNCTRMPFDSCENFLF
jgi:hypothetical protein